MSEASAIQRVLEWSGVLLAAVFVLIGAGILSGLILNKQPFFSGGVKTLIGLVLIGYGITRGVMTYRQIRGRAKKDRHE